MLLLYVAPALAAGALLTIKFALLSIVFGLVGGILITLISISVISGGA